MPRKSSRNPPSQASTSSQSSSQLTQSTINEHFGASQENLDDQVNNCVRYLVYNAGHNACFRKADIQKNCVPRGSNLQRVMERATAILKNVYGYNVLVCDQAEKAGKAYIVSNALPYKNYTVNKDQTDSKDVQKIVLLLILSHILMSNSPVPEASLHSFLKSFKIDVNVRHPLFGSVKDYMTNTLIKQKFLLAETDAVSKKITYSWGIRSEKEISKHDVLKFVCKMYKDCQPKSWGVQYAAAAEQRFENERLRDQQNGMDVDEE